jgi:hypothetical protein
MQAHLKKQPTMIAIATMNVFALLYALFASLNQGHTLAPQAYAPLATTLEALW